MLLKVIANRKMIHNVARIAAVVRVNSFPPSVANSTYLALKMGFERTRAVQPLVEFSDPVALLVEPNQARLDYLGAVEIKRGGIPMLAILGQIIISAGIRFPRSIASEIPLSSVEARLATFETVPPGGVNQVAAFVSLLKFGREDIKEADYENSKGNAAAIEFDDGRIYACILL